MKEMSRYLWGVLLCTTFFIFSCSDSDDYMPIANTDDVDSMTDDTTDDEDSTDDDMDNSVLTIDLSAVPFDTLSEYGFFEDNIADLAPVEGVLEYSLINKLFSDYSIKKRFIWMPENVTATYDADDSLLNFPVGTIIIKNFFYDNVLPENTRRILETRLLIRKDDGWEFADYVWDESQTEATFSLNGSNVPIEWELNGETRSVNYRIPNGTECQTCHKTGDTSIPIGPKPQNLNMTFTYSDGDANQLTRWVEEGYLQSFPSDVNALVYWQDDTQPIEERVRSYFEVNCAHCHIDEGHCSYRPIRLNYAATTDDVNLGICEIPDENLGNGLTHIIRPGNIGRSTLFFRLNTTAEEVRMPLLGRTLIHDEAITLIEEYINQLTNECN